MAQGGKTVSETNASVFQSLTPGQRSRILAAGAGGQLGQEVEGVRVTQDVYDQLRAWESGDYVTQNVDGTTQEQSDQNVITPLAIEGGITPSSANLKYPLDKPYKNDSDYVSIEFFNYKPPFASAADNTSETGGAAASFFDYQASVMNLEPSGLSSIALPMPEDLQAQYGANWGGAGFGALAGQIMKATTGTLDGDAAVDKLLGAGKRAIYKNIVDAANKGLGTSVSTNQAISGREGKIVNPNVEMMYEAPELRNFSLSFKMVAYSAAEAGVIRSICNTFKKAMLPSAAETGLLKVPNICKVLFMTGSSPNPFLSQFKPCAITNVTVNYTPDGAYATYEQGAPVAVNLSVSLKELKLIFAEEITDGSATY